MTLDFPLAQAIQHVYTAIFSEGRQQQQSVLPSHDHVLIQCAQRGGAMADGPVVNVFVSEGEGERERDRERATSDWPRVSTAPFSQ